MTQEIRTQERYAVCDKWISELKSETNMAVSVENPSPLANPNMSVKLVSGNRSVIKYFPQNLWLC